MIKAVIPALVAAMLIAGCGDGAPKHSDAGTPRAADNMPSTNTADNRSSVSIGDAIRLPEGLRMSLDHELRSERHEELAGGKFQHVVVVEFMNVAREKATEVLRRDLTQAGFEVGDTSAIEGGDGFSARGARGVRVDIYVKEPGELTMRSPDANGWIRLAWKDHEE